jgi:hypothetical protein
MYIFILCTRYVYRILWMVDGWMYPNKILLPSSQLKSNEKAQGSVWRSIKLSVLHLHKLLTWTADVANIQSIQYCLYLQYPIKS